MIGRTGISVAAVFAFVFLGLTADPSDAAAPGGKANAEEPARHLELVALDERAGRAVLLDAAGAALVLRLDEETPEGLRLKSASDGAALLDVRYRESGDVIAYRIRLGEAFDIRPLPKFRSGGTQTVVVSPEVRTGAKESIATPAKD